MLIPMATKKPNGKVYRYYVINKKMHKGAEAAQSWNYQAAMLEDTVSEKLLEYLRSERMVDKYWSEIQKINPSIDEPQAVVLILRHTASIWDQFFTKMIGVDKQTSALTAGELLPHASALAAIQCTGPDKVPPEKRVKKFWIGFQRKTSAQ